MTDQPPAPAGQPPEGQVLIYRDGTTNLQVRLDGQTVWLPQRLIAELFQVTVPNVSQHLKAIYDEGELRPEATVKQYLIVQTEGARQVSRLVDHYNLGAILAVGYRVRSSRGTQFRQWATARLSELLVKGFTLDDERIKAGRTLGDDYFEELLARIRDIRASERMFYQKITDIYATSIDYDADAAGVVGAGRCAASSVPSGTSSLRCDARRSVGFRTARADLFRLCHKKTRLGTCYSAK